MIWRGELKCAWKGGGGRCKTAADAVTMLEGLQGQQNLRGVRDLEHNFKKVDLCIKPSFGFILYFLGGL